MSVQPEADQGQPPVYQPPAAQAPHPAYAPPPAGYAPHPAGYAPPPAGYAPHPGGYPPYMMQPQQQQQQQQQSTNVTVVNAGGGMVGCAHTSKSSHFTAGGIILCIFCFPLGVLCCLLMMETRCNNCGALF